MNRLCKTCVHFSDEKGRTMCKFNGLYRNPDDEAPPEFACWVKRPKITSSELSKVRSLCGKKGGRPKGSGKGRTPKKQVQIKEVDYLVLMAYANYKELTMVESVHLVAKSLVKQYPQLKPDCWVD